MRKKTMKMMIIAGAVALLLPTAAMAEWDQNEDHGNQDDHDAMINVYTAGNTTSVHTTAGDFNYGMTSAIGYDRYGDGTAILDSHKAYKVDNLAPWNTTPCPLQLADPNLNWADAMGNCPAQVAGNTIGQTDDGWGEGDNELFGVILDDLYQSLSETATTDDYDNLGTKAGQKAEQVLDILFYRSNTVGDAAYTTDGWTDTLADVSWFGGLGIDQTLDQDIADIQGTKNTTLTGTALWGYNHIAQTLYQDFRLFDLGNSYGPGTDLNHTGITDKYVLGEQTPRNRHGMEMLAHDTADPKDYAFFDQWVVQSLRDQYVNDYSASPQTNFEGSVTLEQSYSSWMAQGKTGDLCKSINQDNTSSESVGCTYDFGKDDHKVNKSVTLNNDATDHQTGQ